MSTMGSSVHRRPVLVITEPGRHPPSCCNTRDGSPISRRGDTQGGCGAEGVEPGEKLSGFRDVLIHKLERNPRMGIWGGSVANMVDGTIEFLR